MDNLEQIKTTQEDQRKYFEKRMDETCTTLTTIGTNYTNHIESEKTERVESQKKLENKYRLISLFLGLVSGVSLIVGFSKYFT